MLTNAHRSQIGSDVLPQADVAQANLQPRVDLLFFLAIVILNCFFFPNRYCLLDFSSLPVRVTFLGLTCVFAGFSYSIANRQHFS